MRSNIFVPLDPNEVIPRIKASLTEDGFVYAEEGRDYEVRYEDGNARKLVTRSRFWSQKTLPDMFSGGKIGTITMEGEVRRDPNGSSTIIEVNIIERHASREHDYGGARAIEKYFEQFCKIFEGVGKQKIGRTIPEH